MDKTPTADEIRARLLVIVISDAPMGIPGLVRRYASTHGADAGVIGAILGLIRDGSLEEIRGTSRTGTARIRLAAHMIAPAAATVQ